MSPKVLFQISHCRWPMVSRPHSKIPILTVITTFQRTIKTLIKREITSNEIVKPSSPTPHILQSYKLSMLDQKTTPTLIPIVLYFSNNINHQTAIEHLKRSLSVILTRFYPLAGRINSDSRSINCNDQGVPFTVAKIENSHGQNLQDLLKNPDLKLARHLLPCEFTWDTVLGPGSSTAMIQVTRFDCGGLAIGAVFWHKIMDAVTVGQLLKCWAHTTLGSSGYKEPVCPNYIAQSFFPQNEAAERASANSHGSIVRRGKSVIRQYVFDAQAISTLKSKISNLGHCSRVEVVSALMWRCFMAASLSHKKSRTIVMHPVNLRRRAQPPFPSDCFGNFLVPSVAWCNNMNNNENDYTNVLGELVVKIRASMSKIDGEYVDRMVGDGGFSGLMENTRRTWNGIDDIQGADVLLISSFCNFGLYDIDFGWGKPTQITICDDGNDDEESVFFNMVWLNDCRSADGGVEAWVTLDEKYMKIFDTTLEKLTPTAYKDPSPLLLTW